MGESLSQKEKKAENGWRAALNSSKSDSKERSEGRASRDVLDYPVTQGRPQDQSKTLRPKLVVRRGPCALGSV